MLKTVISSRQGKKSICAFTGIGRNRHLMTATAGEHSGRYASVCADQHRLLFAAALLMVRYEWDWDIKEDSKDLPDRRIGTVWCHHGWCYNLPGRATSWTGLP
jgi:hypothetical protein